MSRAAVVFTGLTLNTKINGPIAPVVDFVPLSAKRDVKRGNLFKQFFFADKEFRFRFVRRNQITTGKIGFSTVFPNYSSNIIKLFSFIFILFPITETLLDNNVF